MAKWFVVILAGSPSVEGVAKVDPGVKEKLDTGVARLLTRLLTSDCAAEARPLWQAHSKAGMKAAGETLGRLAFQEVLSGDSELFNGYAAKLNPEDFKVLEE